MALPPAGSIGAAKAVALLLDEIDADPPTAVLLWNVLPSYRVLLADGLLHVPLFDVSPGALSFEALDDYFSRPHTGLPYRTTHKYGTRLAGAISDTRPRRIGQREHSVLPFKSSPTEYRSIERPAEERDPVL